MADIGGYRGKILYVDLSRNSARTEPLPREYMVDYIGGQGVSTRLLYDMLEPNTEPLSPENPFILGAGPFVGTTIPGSGKCNITARSPMTNLYGTTGAGHMGVMKFAGYDHIVITGKAEKPVFLKITDEKVEFVDASNLWGMDNYQTVDAVWDQLGTGYSVASIGQAGENLVRESCVIANKYSAFARTGMGALMGSKNLKAIAIKGTGGVVVADKPRYQTLVTEVMEKLAAHPNLMDWRSLGTLISIREFSKLGIPIKNGSEMMGEEFADTFRREEVLERIKQRDVACLACPVGCKHFLTIQGGKYDGHAFPVSCLVVVSQTFGADCALMNWDDAVRSAELCSRYGMDFIEAANIAAFATELYNKEILNLQDTDGLELRWGDGEAVHELLRKVAYREGIGDVLADGPVEAARRIGKGAEYYSLHVKGLGAPSDPRARLSTEAFSSFINPRGSHISHGGITLIPRNRGQLERYAGKVGVPEGEMDAVLEGPEGFDVPRFTRYCEDYVASMEFLGLCVFPIYQRYGIQIWADLYSALTGIATSPESLLRAGERVWTLKRMLNVKLGAGKKDDAVPERFLKESVKFGGKEHGPVDKDYMDELISRYYGERGWDTREGVPTQDKLSQLGLA